MTTNAQIENCCSINNKSKKCLRQKDHKTFLLPRKFTKKQCLSRPVKGFTMRASCAPFLGCIHSNKKQKKTKKTVSQRKNTKIKKKRKFNFK